MCVVSMTGYFCCDVQCSSLMKPFSCGWMKANENKKPPDGWKNLYTMKIYKNPEDWMGEQSENIHCLPTATPRYCVTFVWCSCLFVFFGWLIHAFIERIEIGCAVTRYAFNGCWAQHRKTPISEKMKCDQCEMGHYFYFYPECVFVFMVLS